MEKERYAYLCSEAEAGRDAFVRHPTTNHEGIVASCLIPSGHLVIKTPNQQTHCWKFEECEELTHPKSGPMV
jgi:hypothetical protein